MSFRLVDRALIRPNHCAVYHSLGQAPTKGLVHTGTMLPGFDNDVYLSVQLLEDVCAFLGWPTVESYQEVVQERDELRARVAELEADAAEFQELKESIAGLSRHDFVVRKRAGRRPKEEVSS